MKAMQIENRNLHKLVTLTSKSLKIHMSRSYHQVIPLERYGVGQKLLHHHTIKRGKTENKEMTEPLAKTQLTQLKLKCWTIVYWVRIYWSSHIASTFEHRHEHMIPTEEKIKLNGNVNMWFPYFLVLERILTIWGMGNNDLSFMCFHNSTYL
jgi:hypothetical protein